MKNFFRNEAIAMLALYVGLPVLLILLVLIAHSIGFPVRELARNALPPAGTHHSVP